MIVRSLRLIVLVTVFAFRFSVSSLTGASAGGLRLPLLVHDIVDDDGNAIPELGHAVYTQVSDLHVCNNTRAAAHAFLDKLCHNTHSNAVMKRATSSNRIKLEQLEGHILYTWVKIGKQRFKLVPDSLSQESYVAGIGCRSNPNCEGKALYVPSNQPVFDITDSLDYADGGLMEAKLHVTDIKVGSERLAIPKFAILVADSMNENFNSDKFSLDGVLGLAPVPSVHMRSQQSLVERVANLNPGLDHMVAIKVDMRAQSCWSEITFGRTDPHLYKEPILYFSIPDVSPRWNIKLDSIRVIKKTRFPDTGKIYESVTTIPGLDVSIHTGSLYSYLDRPTMDLLKRRLGASPALSSGWTGHYTVPCARDAEAPVIKFKFGGREFEMPPAALYAGKLLDNPDLCIITFADTPINGVSTFGLAALHSVYLVLRRNLKENKFQVGLAERTWKAEGAQGGRGAKYAPNALNDAKGLYHFTKQLRN